MRTRASSRLVLLSLTALLAALCAASPALAGCPDADGDGICDDVDECFGHDSSGDSDSDGVCADSDCDDTDPERYPGAPELCDGRDNDCDGSVPAAEADEDLDGFAGCAGDCDDTDPERYPGAPELCDGRDNDCDGFVPAAEADEDLDGFAACAGDCDDTDPNNFPGNQESCDGQDNDCDSLVDGSDPDVPDSDGDGANACSDCADDDPEAFPGADELCGDGIDNDCNARMDCTDAQCEASCGSGDLFASHDDLSTATGEGPLFRAPSDGSDLSPDWTLAHSPFSYDLDTALDPLTHQIFSAGLADRGLWSVAPESGTPVVWIVTPAPGEPGTSCEGTPGSAVYYERLGFDREGSLFATGGLAQGDSRALYRLDLDREFQTAREVCIGTLDDGGDLGPSGEGLATGGTDLNGSSIMDLAFHSSGTMWLTAGNQLYALNPPSLQVIYFTQMIDPGGELIQGDGIGFSRTGELRILSGDPDNPSQHWRVDPFSGQGTLVGSVGGPSDCSSFGPCIPSGLSDELPVFLPEPELPLAFVLAALVLARLRRAPKRFPNR